MDRWEGFFLECSLFFGPNSSLEAQPGYIDVEGGHYTTCLGCYSMCVCTARAELRESLKLRHTQI